MMAPKGLVAKRPAASAARAPVAKKPALAVEKASAKELPAEDSVDKACALVSEALGAVPGYPPEVLGVLQGCLPRSLGVLKEERLGMQVRVVEMIEEALKSSEALLRAAALSADESLGKAQTDKASKESEEADCAAVVADKAQAEEAAKAALQGAAAALGAALEAFARAEDEQKAGDADLDTAAGKLAALREIKVDALDALKEGTAAKVQVSVQAVMRAGKDFTFDASLLSALPSAASKAPGDRSSFDGIVLNQAEAEFQRCIDTLEGTIAAGDSAKSERAAKVASAASSLEEAKQAEQAARDALKAAAVERREAEATQRAAGKARKDLEPELRRLVAELAKANASLEKFRTGALAAFQELAERSAPPPPAPAVEGSGAPGEAEEAPTAPAAPAVEAAAKE